MRDDFQKEWRRQELWRMSAILLGAIVLCSLLARFTEYIADHLTLIWH